MSKAVPGIHKLLNKWERSNEISWRKWDRLVTRASKALIIHLFRVCLSPLFY